MSDDAVEVSDYPSVTERLAALGATATPGLLLLPDNFATAELGEAPRYPPETPTLAKVLKAAGVPVGQLVQEAKPAYVVNRGAGWIAPCLFIPAMIALNDPNALSVALNVFSNYVTDVLKGLSVPSRVEFDVIVETRGDKTCKKVHFKGDPKAIPALGVMIQKLADGDDP